MQGNFSQTHMSLKPQGCSGVASNKSGYGTLLGGNYADIGSRFKGKSWQVTSVCFHPFWDQEVLLIFALMSTHATKP